MAPKRKKRATHSSEDFSASVKDNTSGTLDSSSSDHETSPTALKPRGRPSTRFQDAAFTTRRSSGSQKRNKIKRLKALQRLKDAKKSHGLRGSDGGQDHPKSDQVEILELEDSSDEAEDNPQRPTPGKAIESEDEEDPQPVCSQSISISPRRRRHRQAQRYGTKTAAPKWSRGGRRRGGTLVAGGVDYKDSDSGDDGGMCSVGVLYVYPFRVYGGVGFLAND